MSEARMSNDDMVARTLEFVAAARNALSPETAALTPTDELRALGAALDGIEQLLAPRRAAAGDRAVASEQAEPSARPLRDRIGDLLAAKDDVSWQIFNLAEPALAEYVRGLWPTAAAIYVDADRNPTWIVDSDDHPLAIVTTMKESRRPTDRAVADEIWELVSLMDPDQLDRYASTRAFTFKVALPDEESVAAATAETRAPGKSE